ncbi:phosphoethanolamine transferase [Jejudonia soesokkakensis]|uniref:Phosphoethanolamine transferase n=1 Tax=Jejudonia soesokkakensis TaxID=1323432 RepID=A0ABW2MR45_9FLAO
MDKLRSVKPNILFHLFVNIVVVIFITGASYYHTPLDGFKDNAIYLLHLILLQTTVAGLIYFLSLSKWVFRIVFSALFLSYCCFSFWSYSQDVSVTSGLIQAVLESKSDIVIDVITLPYVLFFMAAVVMLSFVLRFHSKIKPRKEFLIFSILALLCVSLYFFIENKRPGTLKNRLPYNVYFGLKDYFKKPDLILNTSISKVERIKDSIKVVFVLGETVRADHLSLNGYERETTPLLEKEGNVISFTKLHTDHTYTGKSVPQILTDQNLGDTIQPLTSVFSVANKANIKTTWIGNQTLEDSFGPITETNSSVILVDKFKSEFSFNKELDEVMLQPLDSVLKTSTPQLITLHMIGSHWWYENRYSDLFRKFTPVIDSKYVPSQSKEQMINSYDNTILYLDYFLSEVIQKLKAEDVPTAMVYVSDHGELLGEDGRWLHAQGGDVLKNPAYIFWFSDSFRAKYSTEVDTLSAIKNEPITTDDVYFRLLHILGIETK